MALCSYREAPDQVKNAKVLAAVKRWVLAMLAPIGALCVAPLPPHEAARRF
jgi:hypothetical protein